MPLLIIRSVCLANGVGLVVQWLGATATLLMVLGSILNWRLSFCFFSLIVFRFRCYILLLVSGQRWDRVRLAQGQFRVRLTLGQYWVRVRLRLRLGLRLGLGQDQVWGLPFTFSSFLPSLLHSCCAQLLRRRWRINKFSNFNINKHIATA